MKVILLEDVKKLGKKGDVVEVSAGYARNFLLSKKLGVEASNKALNDIKLQNEADDRKRQEELEAAQKLGDEIKDKVVTISVKSGANGKIFGSVSTKEIGAKIKEQLGVTVDKKKMVLKDPIKSLGNHELQIKLHPKVTTKITIKVTEA